MSIDNSVRDWRGAIMGFRCSECGGIFTKMWGETCNGCREKERRHQELIDAIRAGGSDATE